MLSFLSKFSDCHGNVLKKTPANLMPQTGVIFTCHGGNILYREQMVENFNNVTRKPCFSPVLALFRLQYLLEILCNLQKKNGSEVALRLKELFFMIQSL